MGCETSPADRFSHPPRPLYSRQKRRPNLATIIDKSRENINNRLPILADYGLVRKIGPSDRSGLYELTEKGERALSNADRYDEIDDFEKLLEDSTLDVEHSSDQVYVPGGIEMTGEEFEKN